MSDKDDFLLYVLSASREMKWKEFGVAFGDLYRKNVGPSSDKSGDIGYQVRRTARIIDALGHCDLVVDESGGRLYVAPSVLARLPLLGLPRAVLCGARGPDTIGLIRGARTRLKRKFEIEVLSQNGVNLCVPQRVLIEAEATDVIADLAKQIGSTFSSIPVSCELVSFGASLNDYLGFCIWQPGEQINWTRRGFDVERLQFRPGFVSELPVRLTKYDNPITTLPAPYLEKENSRAKVDLDWGRYVVLAYARKNVMIHDSRRMLLAVPASAPLPRLLARAATLCSGHAPRFLDRQQIAAESPERRGFEMYYGVPKDIADAIASKLEQVLTEMDLSQTLGG